MTCKRYKNRIITEVNGNQRKFLDQFADEDNIWHGSKAVINYNYFEKNYGINQYDLIMTEENKVCPICNVSKRQFIDYFHGYTTTCNNEICIEEYNARDWIIYRFISPQGKVYEYPRNIECNMKIFLEWLKNDCTTIICPKCGKHDTCYFGNFVSSKYRTISIDKTSGRTIYTYDGSKYKCYPCVHSESSSRWMTYLHHGTNKIARDFQRRNKDYNNHYHFTKKDQINGGKASVKYAIERVRSDVGRAHSSKCMKNTWAKNYQYMYECALRNTITIRGITKVAIGIFNSWTKRLIDKGEFENRLQELININNCKDTYKLISSWNNLIKEWFLAKTVKKKENIFLLGNS